MKRLPSLLLVAVFVVIPVGSPAFEARVETTDGEALSIADFTMDGRQTFSIDQMGGISRLDWKEISSFEIKQVGHHYWIEVLFTNGKKDTFSIRQYSSFRGKTPLGPVLIPFEKVKKVSLEENIHMKKPEETVLPKEPAVITDSIKELDKVTLRNGDILMGELVVMALSIRTVYGTISFKKEDLKHVTLGKTAKGQRDTEKDTLFSKYGDKLSGAIPESSVTIKLRSEATVSIPREHIQEIEFGIPADIGYRIPREPSESSSSGGASEMSAPGKSN